MLLFCPSCSNVLTVSQTASPEDNSPVNRLECQTCPYQYIITKRYFERKNFARKEREDVFGGPGAWDNADKMQVQCPKEECDGSVAAFFQVQIRSADEPMTAFYKCMTCGNRWREN
ncbi:probable DNA-directed RNA polymerase III subunit C11 [Phialocephala subalpina]|uniref:DNA-directed RNA polymerase subunit n=1 Tax=Phialocephala subalpina TaxID=576137 RepID=A0A1L7WFE7_9HELO|nr:probable DNA-directed RNA polymerase III subunit C11 [Phialocephala subalpina]